MKDEIDNNEEIEDIDKLKDIDLDEIDLSAYPDPENDDLSEADEDEKIDEDFADVGGKLKNSMPYIIGGVLTVIVIIAAGLAVLFFAERKETGETEIGTVNVSSNDVSSADDSTENDVIFLDSSGNDVESTVENNSVEETSTYAQTTTEESLTAASAATSSSFTALNQEFLDSSDYENVTSLIEKYFAAYGACDLNEILSLVDYNGGTQITQEEMDERAMIVEDYQDFEFYIIEGMDESSYVVYASYGIKFYNIDTAAPTLTRFYVVTSDDGSYYIYNGEVTSKLNAYLNSVNEYDCVKELSESIDVALGEACETDETLRTLMEILYGSNSTEGDQE